MFQMLKMHWNRKWILLLGSSQGSCIAVISCILQEKTVSECRITERLNCLISKIQTENNCIIFLGLFLIQSLRTRRSYFRIGLFVSKYSSHQKDLIARQMQGISTPVVWAPSQGSETAALCWVWRCSGHLWFHCASISTDTFKTLHLLFFGFSRV